MDPSKRQEPREDIKSPPTENDKENADSSDKTERVCYETKIIAGVVVRTPVRKVWLNIEFIIIIIINPISLLGEYNSKVVLPRHSFFQSIVPRISNPSVVIPIWKSFRQHLFVPDLWCPGQICACMVLLVLRCKILRLNVLLLGLKPLLYYWQCVDTDDKFVWGR